MMPVPIAEIFGLVSSLPIDGADSRLEPVPPGEVIDGTAFFPGGTGLWGAPSNERFPVGGVMVLGNTFDIPEQFAAARQRGFEVDVRSGKQRGHTSPTWRNLLDLLRQAEIDPADCWFTNAYPALLKSASAMGDPRVRPGGDLFRACQQIFERSIALMQPHPVLALGIQPIHFIGRYAPSTSWRNGNFRAIDSANESLIELTVTSHHTRAMALLHPSLRKANLRYRQPYLRNIPDPEAQALLDYNTRNPHAVGTAKGCP